MERSPSARKTWPLAAVAVLAATCEAGAWWWVSQAGVDRYALALGLLGLGLAILVMVLLLLQNWLALQSIQGMNAALERARETGQTLQRTPGSDPIARDLVTAALDSLPVGIAVYDRSGHPILQNPVMATLIAQTVDADGRPSPYAELQHYEQDLGQEPLDLDGQRPAPAAAPAGTQRDRQPVLRRYPDERWVQGYDVQTADGMTVIARADVTPLVRRQERVAQANKQLSRQSTTDGLTGIPNRRSFDATLANEWHRAARSGQSLSLLLVDIDHFKLYNDRYGHVAGDECLRRVARVLSACVRRAGEMVARYGGEEFVILSPAIDIGSAVELAQRCLSTIAQEAIPHASSRTAPHLTFSIGVAHVYPLAKQDPESLVNAADTAMYRAKTAGRARYVVAGQADWQIDKDEPRSQAGELA